MGVKTAIKSPYFPVPVKLIKLFIVRAIAKAVRMKARRVLSLAKFELKNIRILEY